MLQKQNLFLYPNTLVRAQISNKLSTFVWVRVAYQLHLHNKFKTFPETVQVLSYEWVFYSCHQLVSQGLDPSSSADSQVPPCYPLLVPELAPSFRFHPYLDPGCKILPGKKKKKTNPYIRMVMVNTNIQLPVPNKRKRQQRGSVKSPSAVSTEEKLNKRCDL